MKLRILLALALFCLPLGAQNTSILVKRAAITDAKQLTNFDGQFNKGLGTENYAALIAAKADTLQTENDFLVDLYIADKITSAALCTYGNAMNTLSDVKLTALLDHIGNKSTYAWIDATLLTKVPYKKNAAITAHADLILGQFNPSVMEYYILKYKFLQGLTFPKDVTSVMTVPELVLLTKYPITTSFYNIVRSEILSRSIGAVTKARRAANKANNETEFDAEMAPIIAALNAPLWAGLATAVLPYKITVVTPDYTDLISQLELKCDQLDQRKISKLDDCSGSMILYKGTEGYKAWAAQYQ